LEGPTVPRAQEVRVKPTTPFIAHPATLSTPSDHLDLIPTGEVSVLAPIDPYKIMGKKQKPKGKGKQGAQAKKPRRAIYEVITAEQSTQKAESDSAAQEEPTQPPQIVELGELEIATEQPPKEKRARSEVEASELPGSSSSEKIWAPELRARKRPITAQDSVLGTSNVEHSAKVVHALTATACLPGDL
jgi:hypothetical protein